MADFTEQQFIEGIPTIIPIVKMEIISECAEIQLHSKQDITSVFTLDNEFFRQEGVEPVDVIVVMDGHGYDLVPNIIRELNLHEHFAEADPAESIQKAIDREIIVKKEKFDNEKPVRGLGFNEYYARKITPEKINMSGATLSFVKIYRNLTTKNMKIIAEWLGDSPIVVFINGEMVFKSENHDGFKSTEIKRLLNMGVIKGVEDTNLGFKVVSEHEIVYNPGKYIVFNTNDKLAITRSLGHRRITGVNTEKKIIECSTDDDVKVLVFSDGVGDILNLDIDMEKLKTYSSEEIVNFAENRWKQEWLYEGGKERIERYDDCCCAIWSQKKA